MPALTPAPSLRLSSALLVLGSFFDRVSGSSLNVLPAVRTSSSIPRTQTVFLVVLHFGIS
ncbi:MAG: hypothetical protein JWM91_5314 [Rhodospirillales bacterium]|nr:hypothetical protein [Rhodospirillales bacterium]